MTITRTLTAVVAVLLLIAPGSAWAKKDKEKGAKHKQAASSVPVATAGVSATPLTSRHLAVSWTTDTATYGQVELSLTPFKGQEAEGTVFPPAFLSATSYTRVAARTHDLCPTDLKPDTLYHVRVRSKDASGAVKVSEAVSAKTLPSPSQAPAAEFARRDWLGLYSTDQWMKNKRIEGDVMKAPYVRGVSVSEIWSEIESSPGVYSWDSVDRALAEATKSNKFVKLALRGSSKINGKRIPAWVSDGVETATGADAEDERSVKWDPVYACRWWKFVVAYGRRYDERLAGKMAFVGVSGAGSAEMNTYARTLDSYRSLGHTDQQIEGGMPWVWRNLLVVFAEAFPHSRLGIVPGSIPLGGAKRKDAVKDLGDDIVRSAVDTYGRRLVLTHSGFAIQKGGFLIDTLRKYRDRAWTGGLTEQPSNSDRDPVGTLRRLFDEVVFTEGFAFVTLKTDALGMNPKQWGNLPTLKELLMQEDKRFAQMREKS